MTVFVCYGSATGNAEHIAKDLSLRLANSICCELNVFKKVHIPSALPCTLIVVASTTGNGDAPENASRFVRYIKRKTTAPDLFAETQFAVLGLGDTNYDKFCETGRVIDSKLNQLGGTRLVNVGLADEGTGLEDVVEPWIDRLVELLSNEENGGAATAADEIAAAAVEEKEDTKTDALEDIALSNVRSDSTESASLGIQLVQQLLGTNTIGDTRPEGCDGSVHHPRCCELVDPPSVKPELYFPEESSALSSASSIFYNHRRPFQSRILSATYLTDTTPLIVKDPANATPASIRKQLHKAFPLTVERNEKRVLELELELPKDDHTIEYVPGDALGLLPQNPVDSIENLPSYDASQYVTLDPNYPPVTIADALKFHVDLVGTIPTRTLLALAKFAKDPQEALCLQYLATTFYETVEAQRFNIQCILELFPSLQLSIVDLLNVLPPLAARYYSVSSAPSDTVKIAASVVDYVTPSCIVNGSELGQRRRTGVATGHLEVLSALVVMGGVVPENGSNNCFLPIFPKPTQEFHITIGRHPVILIGPGTGVAPFMGFLRQQQNHLRIKSQTEQRMLQGNWRGGFELSGDDLNNETTRTSLIPDIHLLFGCRHESHDFLYQEELVEFCESGVLKRLYTAFSRDTGAEYKYVQHILRDESHAFAKMIVEQQATVYLCGDGNHMAKDVQATLLEILLQYFGNEDKAESYYHDMKHKQGRFLMDIWS